MVHATIDGCEIAAIVLWIAYDDWKIRSINEILYLMCQPKGLREVIL